MSDAQSSGADIHLPPLRQDIQILRGWTQYDGAPSFVLFDPLRNAYFRLTQKACLLLSLWNGQTLASFSREARNQLPPGHDDNEAEALVRFMHDNQLLEESGSGQFEAHAKKDEASRKSISSRMLHNYLFFKIPIARPQKFLDLTWPLVAPLYSATGAFFLTLLGFLAIYFVSRQWDVFWAQFLAFFSWEGLVYYAVSLVLVKVLHELGHAWMATKFRLQVPVIGVAFLVLMPVLYTDTSSAWRLRSRRERLLVDGAGILTELGLAVVATLLWVFLEDGPLRSIAFTTATVSWVMSLAINLNPFMRFDGYYLLSDAIGFENLQSRGFALGRWRLREVLFGLNVKKPEILPQWLERLITLYAWGTWIYRFFLFLGIALLIYSFFIKAVALVLFAVEIAYFIALPILKEMSVWWSLRREIRHSRRSIISFGAVIVLLTVCFWPISDRVAVPALLHAEKQAVVFPPLSAKLTELLVENDVDVERGQILARLQSDDLETAARLSERRISLLQYRIARSGADQQELALRPVLVSQLRAEQKKLGGLNAQISELTIKAPISGRISDLDTEMHIQRHVPFKKALLRIVDHDAHLVTGLIDEDGARRLHGAAMGTFVPDDPAHPSFSVSVSVLGQTAVQHLSDADHAEIYGGGVAVRPVADGSLKPIASYYALTLKPVEQVFSASQTVRGVALIDAEARSLAGRFAQRVAAVLIRESGF